MIIRVVKMSFVPARVPEFLANFEQKKQMIRHFEGCQHLELLKEIGNDNVYFTYSYWDSAQSLEKYRNSPLFKEVWAFTKSLFSDKPAAWSLEQQVKL